MPYSVRCAHFRMQKWIKSSLSPEALRQQPAEDRHNHGARMRAGKQIGGGGKNDRHPAKRRQPAKYRALFRHVGKIEYRQDSRKRKQTSVQTGFPRYFPAMRPILLLFLAGLATARAENAPMAVTLSGTAGMTELRRPGLDFNFHGGAPSSDGITATEGIAVSVQWSQPDAGKICADVAITNRLPARSRIYPLSTQAALSHRRRGERRKPDSARLQHRQPRYLLRKLRRPETGRAGLRPGGNGRHRSRFS